jgi:DNA topoisomerase-1
MGNKMIISFIGKKGVFQEIKLTHTRLARMMNKLKDIPGQELFQYYDKDGIKKTIDSDAVNEYIETSTGHDFTAKDFRTWCGTVEAFDHLADLIIENNDRDADKNIVAALDMVAKKLGNTRAVCKKYYVHPDLLSCYKDGRLDKYLHKLSKLKLENNTSIHDEEEKLIMEFLEAECHCH